MNQLQRAKWEYRKQWVLYPFQLLFSPIFLLIGVILTDFNNEAQYNHFIRVVREWFALPRFEIPF